MIELETRFGRLALQLIEIDVQVGDPLLRVEMHRHGQISLGPGVVHSRLIHGERL
jgi:hypothetical protein